MVEHISHKAGASKEETYQELLPQIHNLIASETDLIANLANISAVLHSAFKHLWTGFYLHKGDDLVLGPFQGPLACSRIALKPIAKGVCGKSAESQQSILVPDVSKFPGHISCSSHSKSEIVVPLVHKGETCLILDIDSTKLNNFDDIDAKHLAVLIDLIRRQHFS